MTAGSNVIAGIGANVSGDVGLGVEDVIGLGVGGETGLGVEASSREEIGPGIGEDVVGAGKKLQ